MNLDELMARINAAHSSDFTLEDRFELGESQQAFRIHDQQMVDRLLSRSHRIVERIEG